MSTRLPAISILSGTDRLDSNSYRLASIVRGIADRRGHPTDLFSLRDMPRDLDRIGPYGEPGPEMQAIIDRHIRPFAKLMFVIPEYNGGFPGILKLFMDSVHPRDFHGRQAALIGLSDGRSGNLRGLDHFATILNYVRVNVLWHKPRLMAFSSLLDGDGALPDWAMELLNEQLDHFERF
ncbi:MAG: NAD(P)H-dependent oxidoreductase [Flavobacteriales bacterium]|nr:NAD(P)H-dependent oxidoreductase [Flavobacteriales bacterium]